jgi:hypothetical protein
MFWSILKVIAFAGIRLRIAAEGTIFSEGCVAGASAILTRAQGGAFPAEFTWPMSRRENTQHREFLLPPRGAGTHADRHQQCSNGFDLSVWREPGTLWRWPVARSRSCGAAGLAKVFPVLQWISRPYHRLNWSMLMVS